jgi:hypothetical protein
MQHFSLSESTRFGNTIREAELTRYSIDLFGRVPLETWGRLAMVELSKRVTTEGTFEFPLQGWDGERIGPLVVIRARSTLSGGDL